MHAPRTVFADSCRSPDSRGARLLRSPRTGNPPTRSHRCVTVVTKRHPFEPEDVPSKIQGDSSPSGHFDNPTSSEVQQEATRPAGFEITPSVEVEDKTSQRVNDLTKQVDDLKKQLQSKTFDLQEERDRRIACQAEVKSQQEEIQRLQELLQKERHQQVKRDHDRKVAETTGGSRASCSTKVTADRNLLQQLDHYKRQAEKCAAHNKGLIEVMVEEYRVRLQYEEQLKRHAEQATKFIEQEEMVKALQGQIADLKSKLKLALENDHPRVFSQPKAALVPQEIKERQTLSQPGVSIHSLARPMHQLTHRLQTEESTQTQTSAQTLRSEERPTSMQPTSTGCTEGLRVGVRMKGKLCPARPLRRPTPGWNN
ncbi:uncharacterized protein LOC129361677 [Poeciliopsis prolifica]|uniref:uncharacterized protein LOC129361677 n=1 Tax=Poeciliopsis prolifica TaxID=188132 RepID=UPI00241304CD|nr:uncharacterized protein LOC129361677 [Poeciliopsis prolifica]